MKRLIAAIVLALAMVSARADFVADEVYKDAGGEVHISHVQECAGLPDNVMKSVTHAEEQYGVKHKAAKVVIDGKDYKACWTQFQGLFYVIDEDGDTYGPFYPHQFMKSTSS